VVSTSRSTHIRASSTTLGIQQYPKSTLADANERCDYRIYEGFAKSLMHQARRQYAHTRQAMDVDDAVYALGASASDLTLSLFPSVKSRVRPSEPSNYTP
jgi:hypothetical protein